MSPTITIKHGNENLVSHSGLLHVGALLNAINFSNRFENLPDVHCVNPKIPHGDILSSMVALICVGKSDYSAIENYRTNPVFFTHSLGIGLCPSQTTLRERINLIGESANEIIKAASAEMIREKAPAITPVNTSSGNFIPLDLDVSPFDNSKTNKEGVSRTYKGDDGYAPMFGYLGAEGYLINTELRKGSQHCQKDTPEFIRCVLKIAREITQEPLLIRLDSGNDSKDNYEVIGKWENVEFLVKRNLRKESLYDWLSLAQNTEGVELICLRHKKVWIGQTTVDQKGSELPRPIVFKVTERYEKKGEPLLIPDIEVETYWCTLSGLSCKEVINLYHDHGTSEQFHSEIKSDLDAERFPSSHFKSNSLILHLTLLAYNILRIIGQMSIEEQKADILPANRKNRVSRRRIKTVMQDFIYMAGRFITKGRQWFISFGKINPFAQTAERILNRVRYAPG